MDNTKHSKTWTENNHYGLCGQSCPCCRAIVEEGNDPFGVCPICWDKKMKSKTKSKSKSKAEN